MSRLSPPIRVAPKNKKGKAKALIWANDLDSDPHKEDERVWHESLVVHEGEKHAAHVWIHMSNVRTPVENCSG